MNGTDIKDIYEKIDRMQSSIAAIEKSVVQISQYNIDREKLNTLLRVHERVTALEKTQWWASGMAAGLASALTFLGHWIMKKLGG